MTMLVDRVCDEVLRHLYAFTRRWPASLAELALLGLAATFVIAAWRFREAGGPHGPRPAQPGREDA